MKVVIAGAGKVGRAIARELVSNGHSVLLIDKDPALARPGVVEGASALLADACEIAALEEAELTECQVVVAATGDDKVNLVVSLLAKTEYGVPRVVARVNHPKNEWMFDQSWGVDVAVSTPRMLSALVEEAVSVGDLVRLFTFRQGEANLVVAIVRGPHVITPSPDDPLEVGDELLFVAVPDQEPTLQRLLGHA
jgi:trk system potassium uptake protein TrkA